MLYNDSFEFLYLLKQQVVPHEVIEIDADDEPEGAVIIGEKGSVDKNKKAVVHPIDWPKHSKVNFLVSVFLCYLLLLHITMSCTQALTDSFLWQQIQSSLLHDVAGPSTCTFKKTDPWFGALNKTESWFGTLNKTDPWFGHKPVQDESIYNYSDDYPYEGYEDDYAYDEDEYEDDGYDTSLIESEYNYSLTAKFDGLAAPGAEASLPWLQKTSIENASKTKPTKTMNEITDEKYKAFKQFDTVNDHSDHYYLKPELRKVQIVKKVKSFFPVLSIICFFIILNFLSSITQCSPILKDVFSTAIKRLGETYSA